MSRFSLPHFSVVSKCDLTLNSNVSAFRVLHLNAQYKIMEGMTAQSEANEQHVVKQKIL